MLLRNVHRCQSVPGAVGSEGGTEWLRELTILPVARWLVCLARGQSASLSRHSRAPDLLRKRNVAASARVFYARPSACSSPCIDAKNAHPFGRARRIAMARRGPIPPCGMVEAGVSEEPRHPTIKRSRAPPPRTQQSMTPALVTVGFCCRLSHRGRTPDLSLRLSSTRACASHRRDRPARSVAAKAAPPSGEGGAVRRAHCLVRSSRRSTGPYCQSHAALCANV
jgi:hypothetical protein